MRILTYRDLRPGRFSKALDRLRVAISQGNFAAAGLKKLSPTNYWRAKLSDEARLLLTFQPYNGECPELNPAENLWQFIRDNRLSNRIFKSYEDILDHCCFAWNKLIDQPWRIMSIGLRDWARAS